MTSMTVASMIVHAKKARLWAVRRTGLYEDFAQDCFEKWLTGKRDPRTSFKFLLADFLRLYGPHKRDGGFRDPIYMPHEKLERFDEARTAGQISDHKLGYKGIVDELPNWLSERQRIVVILYFNWGFTETEIAHVIGITESRISKVLTAIKGLSIKIKRARAREEKE